MSHVLKDGLVISITPTLDTAPYVTGDVLFVATKLQEAALNTKGVSVIRNIIISDGANQKAAIDFLLFNDVPPSVGAVNAALAITDLSSFIGRVSVAAADYTTLKAATNAECTKSLEFLVATKQKLRDIWVVAVVRDGPTYAANSLTIRFVLERLS